MGPCTAARRATMVFNVESRLEDDPRGPSVGFAKVPFIQQGT
jgi:para-nitrobenzyl esterase